MRPALSPLLSQSGRVWGTTTHARHTRAMREPLGATSHKRVALARQDRRRGPLTFSHRNSPDCYLRSMVCIKHACSYPPARRRGLLSSSRRDSAQSCVACPEDNKSSAKALELTMYPNNWYARPVAARLRRIRLCQAHEVAGATGSTFVCFTTSFLFVSLG